MTQTRHCRYIPRRKLYYNLRGDRLRRRSTNSTEGGPTPKPFSSTLLKLRNEEVRFHSSHPLGLKQSKMKKREVEKEEGDLNFSLNADSAVFWLTFSLCL